MFVFFDLPTKTATDRHEYSRFRRHLLKSGFLMLQKSVYTKLTINGKVFASVIDDLRSHRPSRGSVLALLVTERQYSNITYIVGDKVEHDEIDDTESLVIL